MLAAMHCADIVVPGVRQTRFDPHPTERIEPLLRRAGECPVLAERGLLDHLQRFIAINDPKGELFLSTVGVNSAFRAAALRQINGFDEQFHYFLDESDVCLRLVKAGWGAAIAPYG